MNPEKLNFLSRDLQIAFDAIVAEEYEMLVMKRILNHEMSHKMVFKGGTALRLAYFSRRFSEDLDFSMVKKGSEKEFKDMVNLILKDVPNLTVQIAREKYYCYFARFQIHDPNLERTFGMKLEISKKPEKLLINKDYFVKDLISPTVSFALTSPVIDLLHVRKDKIQALKKRKKGRDVYDFWFLCERLGGKFKFDKRKFSKHDLEEELHRFLPRSDWRLINSWYV